MNVGALVASPKVALERGALRKDDVRRMSAAGAIVPPIIELLSTAAPRNRRIVGGCWP